MNFAGCFRPRTANAAPSAHPDPGPGAILPAVRDLADSVKWTQSETCRPAQKVDPVKAMSAACAVAADPAGLSVMISGSRKPHIRSGLGAAAEHIDFGDGPVIRAPI